MARFDGQMKYLAVIVPIKAGMGSIRMQEKENIS